MYSNILIVLESALIWYFKIVWQLLRILDLKELFFRFINLPSLIHFKLE
jgi:hypothetical protein